MFVGRHWKWFWAVSGLISIAIGLYLWGISLHSVAGAHQEIAVQFRPFGGGFVLLGVAEVIVAVSSDGAFAAICAFVSALLFAYALIFGGWTVK